MRGQFPPAPGHDLLGRLRAGSGPGRGGAGRGGSGTEEIRPPAARRRTVPAHYVSALGVYVGWDTGGAGIKVSDLSGPGEPAPTGYTQSKWAAEQIIELARERVCRSPSTGLDAGPGVDVGAGGRLDLVGMSAGSGETSTVRVGRRARFRLAAVRHASHATGHH
ncbi:SDR family oxidoreductase [Streptomyces sp. NL15-2K]|uniref:SDR family oxidoreductase n=1 Tax=Streptomyces sp. NL15-2K TaxID=376149 RepID=UPI000FFACFCD|nr:MULTISPECIES: SDR family oxidoreductase [Actinomycetes]WKX13179.1 SDR family oxidoreductase [Kutzneria buriramensis]GCB45482.1 type I polyketide synthase [Streptomyces sp. NL15-2K]